MDYYREALPKLWVEPSVVIVLSYPFLTPCLGSEATELTIQVGVRMMAHQFKGISLTVSYPDDECEVAIPTEGSFDDLVNYLRKLCETEPEMTSFVLVAAKARPKL